MDPISLGFGIGLAVVLVGAAVERAAASHKKALRDMVIYSPADENSRMSLEFHCKSVRCYKLDVNPDNRPGFMAMMETHGLATRTLLDKPFVHHCSIIEFEDFTRVQQGTDPDTVVSKFLWVTLWPTGKLTGIEFDTIEKAETAFKQVINPTDPAADQLKLCYNMYWKENVERELNRKHLEEMWTSFLSHHSHPKSPDFAQAVREWAFKIRTPTQFKFIKMRDSVLKPFFNTAAARERIDALGDIATLNILDINFAVLGINNAGKSRFVLKCMPGNTDVSLIRPESGAGDTTMNPARFAFEQFGHQVAFYDMPAGGTVRIKAEDYVKVCMLGLFDAVILLQGNTTSELDYNILRAAQQQKIPAFLVRHRFDETVEGKAQTERERLGRNLRADELAKVEKDCMETLKRDHEKFWAKLRLPAGDCPKLYFASSKSDDFLGKYTRAELMRDLAAQIVKDLMKA